jgi:2-polyprenyl-3-methyl-5-hydroxy-6-metoxy-1,4-benzoquinol methylase
MMDSIAARASKLNWFHAIDLGKVRTAGRFPEGRPQNASLFGVIDMLGHINLKGRDCVDIGTADGLIAFGLKAKGARRVVATDISEAPRPQFALAREALSLDVEYYGDTDVENICDRLGQHHFDLVVCAGVMYHMVSPFNAILKARQLLKRDGILIVQTYFDRSESKALMRFHQTESVTGNLNTFWTPSKGAVDGMMWLGGFEVMAGRTVISPQFYAAIGRNAPLGELAMAPGMIHQFHVRGSTQCARELRAPLPQATSPIRYSGPRDWRDIDPAKYEPDFFPHPANSKPSVGYSQVSKKGTAATAV